MKRVVCTNKNITADLIISSRNFVARGEIVKLREMTRCAIKVGKSPRFPKNAVNYNVSPFKRNELCLRCSGVQPSALDSLELRFAVRTPGEFPVKILVCC